jgi:hypothetical protein
MVAAPAWWQHQRGAQPARLFTCDGSSQASGQPASPPTHPPTPPTCASSVALQHLLQQLAVRRVLAVPPASLAVLPAKGVAQRRDAPSLAAAAGDDASGG